MAEHTFFEHPFYDTHDLNEFEFPLFEILMSNPGLRAPVAAKIAKEQFKHLVETSVFLEVLEERRKERRLAAVFPKKPDSEVPAPKNTLNLLMDRAKQHD